MIKENSYVRFKKNYSSTFLNDDMKNFIEKSNGKIYKVEKVVDDSVKLFKVGFWVSMTLLEKIKDR
jgi:hypothetical protein